MRHAIVLVISVLAMAVGGTAQAAKTALVSRPLHQAVLTQDGAGTYLASKINDRVTVRNATAGTNQREVIWPTQVPRRDGQVCATWAAESSPDVQEGLALRITTSGGRARAVTISKNVVFGITWVINAHVWDSASPEPFVGLGQWDMGAVLSDRNGGIHPLPWRVCARTVGAKLTWKLWVPAVHAEPGWDDPTHARQATIPAGWVGPGTFGWYAGHVPLGGHVVYSASTWSSPR